MVRKTLRACLKSRVASLCRPLRIGMRSYGKRLFRQPLRLLPVGLLVLSLLVMTHFALAAVLGSNQLNISKAGADAGYPAIAVSQDGQNIGIVWTNKFAGATAINGPIYMKTASDGATLNHKITVDAATSINDQSFTPDVASDPNEDKMHVVWTNLARPGGTGTDLYYTIYYASCSTMSGTCSQETIHQVNNTDDLQTVGDPKVATTNFGGATVVHVVWQFIDPATKTIYYSARKTNSSDWETNRTIVSDQDTEYASHPAIATSVGTDSKTYVHVAWASDTGKGGEPNEKISYRRGTVDGITGFVTSWSGVQEWDMGSAIHPDYPAIAAISDTVMVFWDELEGGPLWPDLEYYYAVYNLSHDQGGSFLGPQHFYSGTTQHRSDHTTGAGNPLQGSEHARRLQIKATAQLTGTAGITPIIHAVWHETNTNLENEAWHDVRYAYFVDGGGGEWQPMQNETAGKKYGSNPNALFYSMSPDIAVANDEIYVVYMEGKEDGGYDVSDPFIFDVIYNGTVALTDNASGVYLPIIMKNSS